MSEPGPVQQLRDGRYAVLGVLGAGSQGETLDAVDKRDGTAVAIKRFQVRGAKSWKEVELAEREARVLSTLSHPNLPVYVEHFEQEGALYLVMRKIEGETLSALRKRHGSLSTPDIERFLRDADDALGYLHGRVPPIVHRDLKPGNVIRQPDGRFVFVDFGSVRDQLKPEGGSTVVGTFGYMAPEQFQGRALPTSDLYAVGATLLALVTGQKPENLPHRGLAIDVTAALAGAGPSWLGPVLTALLEPDPDRRPRRIAPLLSRHMRAESGAPPPASTRDWRPPGDNRAARRQARDEARAGRRHAREQARHGRWRARAGPHGTPFPLVPLFLLGLLAARVATWALFTVLLPTLLSVLSLLFGRGLRRAALRCREVGVAGDRGLVHAMSAVRGYLLQGGEHEPSEPHVRVAAEPPLDLEADAEHEHDDTRRRHRL
jgi:hypothetical protein